MTGCINPAVVDSLTASDPGGQYDSRPGSDGSSTVCTGYVRQTLPRPSVTDRHRYKHYVELIEPTGPRACIRCCDDENDCPMNKGKLAMTVKVKLIIITGTLGCPNVVPGNYFSCP